MKLLAWLGMFMLKPALLMYCSAMVASLKHFFKEALTLKYFSERKFMRETDETLTRIESSTQGTCEGTDNTHVEL